jgi:predicted aspartyl protease
LAVSLAGLRTTIVAAQVDCGSPQFSHDGLTYDNRGRPLLPVTIGELKKTMLLDTGSALSALEMDQVMELALPQFYAGTTMTAITGESSSLATEAETFSLGNIDRDRMRFMILPGFDYKLSAEEPVGILALDFFADYDLELDFAGNEIRLFSLHECVDPGGTRMSDTAVVIPFERALSEFITIPVSLDGVGLSAILDTGAAYSVLNLDVAAQHFGIDVSNPDERISRVDSDDAAATYARRFSELNLGGLEVAEPTITLFPNLLGGTAMTALDGKQMSLPELILGMDLLQELHLYISFREQNIYASPARH